jgi:hypothetical protein
LSWLSVWLERKGLRKRWVRGRDRRSFAQRYIDRRAGEPGIVHIFGDSHSWALERVPRSVLHDLPGTTMFRVGRDRAWFLERTRRRRGRHSALLLTFGEIDVRVHIREVAGETGRDASAVIDELATRYLDAVATGSEGRSVAICAVSPPADNEMAASGDLPAVGTVEDRLALTRAMNEALERGCAARGFLFCDPYRAYADPRGCLRRQLSDGNVHINRAATAPLVAALQPTLAALRGGPGRRPAPAGETYVNSTA